MKGNLRGTPLVVPPVAVRCACGCARESDRERRMAEARLFVRFLYLCATWNRSYLHAKDAPIIYIKTGPFEE